VTNLKCEYLSNPLGIDSPKLRLSRQMADGRKGARQTAYRLAVGTDSAEIYADKNSIWDTGPKNFPK